MSSRKAIDKLAQDRDALRLGAVADQAQRRSLSRPARPAQGRGQDHRQYTDKADRQPNAECALEAQNQLRPAEAIDAQILLEPARQRYLGASAVLWMQLTR